MHPALFSVKRIHLAGLRKQRKVVREMIGGDLTPVRVELLRLVNVYRHAGFVFQSRFADVFGVVKSSISRALKALERDGYVVRWRYDEDRRYKLIKLTAQGRDAMMWFYRAFLCREPYGQFEEAFLPNAGLVPDYSPIYRLFNRVRRALEDPAPFLHPWNRRDCVRLPEGSRLAAVIGAWFQPTILEENDVDDYVDDLDDADFEDH